MAAREKPLHKQAADFVRWHLGKRAFAPFTGQDDAAWCAFVYAARCWAVGGGDPAIEAMRWALLSAQAKCWPLFLQAIPAVADWCHAEELWPKLVERTCLESTAGGRPVRRKEEA